jgi:sugar phosphate isomerase/epimerase
MIKMKKRSLIKAVSLIIIGGIIGTAFFSCTTSTPQKNIGLQLYSVRDSIKGNVPGAIQKVGAMGYAYLEAAGYADGKFYGVPPAEFKALCEKNGLKLLGSHTGRPVPDSTNFEETMKWWDICIDAHSAAGVKWIVQPSMSGDAYKSLGVLKKYCDYFNVVGEKCNAKGIRFGYHNHDRELAIQLDSVTIYDFMLKNTDPSKVMFQMDLRWVVVGGKNPLDYFKKYPGRFEIWHIRDKAEIGASGEMDFAAIWAAAAQSGMKYGVVELDKFNFDQFTSCRKSIEFLNSKNFVVLPQ